MNEKQEITNGHANPNEMQTLSAKEVARALGVSRATLLRWVRAKKIEGFFRIDTKWLIRKSDFERFINSKVAESEKDNAATAQ